MAKIRNGNSMFDKLFEINCTPEERTKMIDNRYYSWFYFRQSPRDNVKFGITHLLWERLRMQQQGTDEEVHFNHVWLVQARYKAQIDNIEKELKNFYKTQCLHNATKRGGHTEWYSKIDVEEFSKLINKFTAELHDCEIVKVPLKKPYSATNSSQCPLGLPSNNRYKGKEWIQEWTRSYWKTLVT
jgi:hypothetical protein